VEERLPGKLAAILYADVAGYSRLTGEDEEGTHRRLSEYLDLISTDIGRHDGCVVHHARHPGARHRCDVHGQHRQVIRKGVALFRLGEPIDAQIPVAGDEKRCEFLLLGTELD
jgi:class 3 adenylate cyclase